MHFTSALAQLSLLTTASASAVAVGQQHYSRDNTIKSWGPCWHPEDLTKAELPIVCTNLSVPLDYTDKSCNKTHQLELLRVPAASEHSKGSILFNFGGPGAPDRADIAAFAHILRNVTGGDFDLVTFVPRGTSEPLLFECYKNSTTEQLDSLQLPAMLGNQSDIATGHNWVTAEIRSQECAAYGNETGQYLSTAFVARDLMQIVDALGEDGMLRYWGISYGTALGATVAAMFPDKIDKLVLDGVANAHEYMSIYDLEMFSDTDNVFTGFCKGCVAAPKVCPLAGNFTAEQLEKKLYDLLWDLKYHPIPIYIPDGGSTVVDYTMIKALVFQGLYDPTSWPGIANILYATMTKNMTFLAEKSADFSSASPGYKPDPKQGIKCGDKGITESEAENVFDVIKTRHEMSKIDGDGDDRPLMECARWKIKAKERYEGDFKADTKNPALLIANSFDPVTPLVSAKNMSHSLKDSVVLEHKAYGHSTLYQASLCTSKIIQAYFKDGKLPDEGTSCEIEPKLFSGEDGWDEVIAQLSK